MIELEQRSAAWHEFRAYHLGSSESAIIMNGSHFEDTPLTLYNRKIRHQEWIKNEPNWEELILNDSKKINYGMSEGIRKEPLALEIFERDTGFLMTPTVRVHPIHSFMSASLDGYELNGACACEIKCPGKEDHELALRLIIPEKYIPQTQKIMVVCGLSEMYYMSYVSDLDYIIFKVYKDNDYCKRLIQSEIEFWNRIQERNPPASTNKDYPKINNPEWEDYVQQWNSNQKNFDFCVLEQERIKGHLIRMADDKSAEGCGLRLTKTFRKGNIQYSNVPHLIGVDLEPYRSKPTEMYRISTKEDF